MVELFESDLRENERQSSKGNQLKWENSGIWYKADYTGYEGLAEYIVSQLLSKSSLKKEEYVLYEPEQIHYKAMIYNGAKSIDFVNDDWQIITLERLYKLYTGNSLTTTLWHIYDAKERLLFLVEQLERISGLQGWGVYLNKLFTIDAMFLNEDRHLHNIAVLMNRDGHFAFCPFFDHGGSLLSDITMDYPLTADVYQLLGEVKAKTISQSFDEQLDISEELYGENIRFFYTKQDVHNLLESERIYSNEIKTRVETVLLQNMRKYRYLWK